MTQIIVRKSSAFDVVPLTGKVIKCADINLISSAKDLLSNIQKHGDVISAKAVAEGRQLGESEGKAAMADLLSEAAIAVKSHLRNSENHLREVVVAAVKRIIGEFDISEQVDRLVNLLVSQTKDEEKITLYVSPSQHDNIKGQAHQLAQQYDIGSIDVMADPSLADDGCRVETPIGSVETSVNAQIERLEKAIDKYLGKGHSDEHTE